MLGTRKLPTVVLGRLQAMQRSFEGLTVHAVGDLAPPTLPLPTDEHLGTIHT